MDSPNSNTVWFNLQMYIIFSINLVSLVTLRSSRTYILYGCHLLLIDDEGVDMVEWSRTLDVRLSEWCCSVSMVWVQIPSREGQKFFVDLSLFLLHFNIFFSYRCANILDVYLSFLFVCTESLPIVSDPTSRRFIFWLLFQTFII
jgi:hypothetical protein